MNNEPNKPIPAQELTEKELEGVVGGTKVILPIFFGCVAAYARSRERIKSLRLFA